MPRTDVTKMKEERTSHVEQITVLDRSLTDAEMRVIELSERLTQAEDQLHDKQEIIDNLYEHIDNNKRCTEIGKKLLDVKHLPRCPASPLASRLYALAWAQAPKLSADALSLIIPTIVTAYLAYEKSIRC